MMKNELYSNDEMCMQFSNYEIYKYFINPLNEILDNEVKVSFYKGKGWNNE